MVMTRVSGDGCWTSMLPPPVWVQPDRRGVTRPLREPTTIDTSGATDAVVTVMFNGCPGWAVFGGCPAGSAAGSRPTATATPAPRAARRVMRVMCVILRASPADDEV